jgi:hypothetical protein
VGFLREDMDTRVSLSWEVGRGRMGFIAVLLSVMSIRIHVHGMQISSLPRCCNASCMIYEDGACIYVMHKPVYLCNTVAVLFYRVW